MPSKPLLTRGPLRPAASRGRAVAGGAVVPPAVVDAAPTGPPPPPELGTGAGTPQLNGALLCFSRCPEQGFVCAAGLGLRKIGKRRKK